MVIINFCVARLLCRDYLQLSNFILLLWLLTQIFITRKHYMHDINNQELKI